MPFKHFFVLAVTPTARNCVLTRRLQPRNGGRRGAPPVRARQCLAPTYFACRGQAMPDPYPCFAMFIPISPRNVVNSITKPSFSDGFLRFLRYLWKNSPMLQGLARTHAAPLRWPFGRVISMPLVGLSNDGVGMPRHGLGRGASPAVGDAARRRIRATQWVAPT